MTELVEKLVSNFMTVVSTEWSRSRYTWHLTPTLYEQMIDELTPVCRFESVEEVRYGPELTKLQTDAGVLRVVPCEKTESELGGSILWRLSDGDAVLAARQMEVVDE